MLPEAPARDVNRVTPGAAAWHSDPSGRVGGGAAPAPGPGLVERVTTPPGFAGNAVLRQQTTSRDLPRGLLKNLNQARRLQRMRRVVAHSADTQRDACEYGGKRYRTRFETLTYRPGSRWRPEHITEYVERRRKWMRKRGIPVRYQWVVELQEGRIATYGCAAEEAIHYHVLWWLPHRAPRFEFADKSALWPHGLSKIEKPRKPVAYMVKYASKGTETDLPKGCRLFGVGSPDEAVRFKRHRSGLPRWLDQRASPLARCSRQPGGGWVDKLTGEIHRSPYRLVWGSDSEGFAFVQLWEMLGEP